jgi:hypothetical protein
VRDIGYLEWAVEKVILDRNIDESVIHIHGDLMMFSNQNIKQCTIVKGGHTYYDFK